jgi:predicted Zn-dependent protease
MDFKILAHELGHVLGLGHDMESQTSIMRPIQPYEFVPTFLTRKDAAALRALYCR